MKVTCPRCEGTGNVKAQLRGIIKTDCADAFQGCLCFLMLFCFLFAVIGGGIGILMFYLLKTVLDYFICKLIFYIITGYFFFYTIAIIVNAFEERPCNIWLDIVFIGLSIGNYFIGDLL